MDEERPGNRLASESSPYLLQHARNPVDWYPWGDEALARARELDRPIFLSIGYAACHWCHVMEHESFEDPAVASLLNRRFVPVKVDREERPDIDAVYMAAVQAMTGGGGWPLSVFMTPGLIPFFGGTYFPPERRWNMPSFSEVLTAVDSAWRERRGEIDRQTAALADHLAALSRPAAATALDVGAALTAALEEMAGSHDPRAGGFGSAPKFPAPSRLSLLLRLAAGGDARASSMLSATLDGMAAGGMHDWVGGGFHRYSVDGEWLIPHFEKMLYDNALLARLYGAAGLLLDRPEWIEVARRTADYLLREMQGREGGFFASTDADSEGEEGRFFTWTAAEVGATLGADEARAVIALCGLDGEPNFEHGRSVLRPLLASEAVARRLGVGPDEAAARIERGRLGLYEARRRRLPPLTDDKRLAGWNGMAAWALAWLGAALGEPRYLAAARRAGEFLLRELVLPDGRLVRSWRDDRRSGAETLEDLAWVTAALVELYQADGDTRWLAAALAIVDARLPRYRHEGGVLFELPDDGEALPQRVRSPLDGATPASAGVMTSALLRLGTLTGRSDLVDAARAAVEAEALVLGRAPEAACALLESADDLARPPTEVVIVGAPADPSTVALLQTAHRSRRPFTLVAPANAVPVPAATARLVPLFRGREQLAGERALAYLCEGGSCRLPTTDPVELADALDA